MKRPILALKREKDARIVLVFAGVFYGIGSVMIATAAVFFDIVALGFAVVAMVLGLVLHVVSRFVQEPDCGCVDDCLIPGQATGAGDVCLCDPVSSCPNQR